jgi:hypothetical protein
MASDETMSAIPRSTKLYSPPQTRNPRGLLRESLAVLAQRQSCSPPDRANTHSLEPAYSSSTELGRGSRTWGRRNVRARARLLICNLLRSDTPTQVPEHMAAGTLTFGAATRPERPSPSVPPSTAPGATGRESRPCSFATGRPLSRAVWRAGQAGPPSSRWAFRPWVGLLNRRPTNMQSVLKENQAGLGLFLALRGTVEGEQTAPGKDLGNGE